MLQAAILFVLDLVIGSIVIIIVVYLVQYCFGLQTTSIHPPIVVVVVVVVYLFYELRSTPFAFDFFGFLKIHASAQFIIV